MGQRCERARSTGDIRLELDFAFDLNVEMSSSQPRFDLRETFFDNKLINDVITSQSCMTLILSFDRLIGL